MERSPLGTHPSGSGLCLAPSPALRPSSRKGNAGFCWLILVDELFCSWFWLGQFDLAIVLQGLAA